MRDVVKIIKYLSELLFEQEFLNNLQNRIPPAPISRSLTQLQTQWTEVLNTARNSTVMQLTKSITVDFRL